MRCKLDTEINALYIYCREIDPGEVTRTGELEEGVNLYIDSAGRILGLEFVNADTFQKFLSKHGGKLDIPERQRSSRASAWRRTC